MDTGSMAPCRECTIVCMLVATLAGPLLAGTIDLHTQSLQELLGDNNAPATGLLTTDMAAQNLTTTVHSQAFTDGAGRYAYLYQIVNVGASGNSPVEQFTLWPFVGADDGTEVGTLIGTIPSGFLPDPAQAPHPVGFVEQLKSGPLVSFYYSLLFGAEIDVGEHSAVMYVTGRMDPGRITGNVIDGAVASGVVVGPVPEPATLSLLSLGALGAVVRRRR